MVEVFGVGRGPQQTTAGVVDKYGDWARITRLNQQGGA
jgi:hypothetical protein